MEDKLVKIWIPIKKTGDKFNAILTDTSLDSDNEMMAESVMDQLKTKMALPALADHDNSMGSWIGGFKNLEKVNKNGHWAIKGEPNFFSKEANPKAAQIKKQMEEAQEMGLSAGISIGARPIASKTVQRDGKDVKQWTELDVREATFTPVQSNTNSYAYVAKSFGLEGQEKILKKTDETINKKPEVTNMSKEEEAKKLELEKKMDADKKKKADEDAKKAEADKKAADDKKKSEEGKITVTKEELATMVQKSVEDTLKKAPLYKAITENIAEQGEPEKKTGFLEQVFTKRAHIEVEK